MKIKGIVDGFRNPRPWYHDVKKVYSPVRVGEKLERSGQSVTFDIENRYSFTNLSELKSTWQLMREGKSIASGDVKLDAPAMGRDA